MTRKQPRWLAVVAVWAVVFGTSAAGSAVAAIIQLKPTASVTGPVVRLQDVADVVDSNVEHARQLGAIMLAPAPSPGRPVRLPFSEIRSRLQANGVNLAETQFSGASVIAVSAASDDGDQQERIANNVSRAQYERAEKLVTGAVLRQLTLLDRSMGDVTVHVDIAEKDVPLILAGYVSGYEIRDLNPRSSDLQTVMLRFLDRRQNSYEVGVKCRIAPHPYVLVAKRVISRGQVIGPDDVTGRQVENSEGFAANLEDVIHHEATRTIRTDEPIRIADVQAVPLVRSNDIVTVTSRHGLVMVRKQTKARNSGALGDMVQLITLDSREPILARVVGVREAETVDSTATSVRVTQNTGPEPGYRQPTVRTPDARYGPVERGSTRANVFDARRDPQRPVPR